MGMEDERERERGLFDEEICMLTRQVYIILFRRKKNHKESKKESSCGKMQRKKKTTKKAIHSVYNMNCEVK